MPLSRNVALLALLALSLPASAGLFGKKTDPADGDEPVEPAADRPTAPKASKPSLAQAPPMWPAGVPVSCGALPAGLANLSVQGCAACHAPVVAQWRQSAHAGPPSDALLQAAAAAGRPDCLSCHLPLVEQHRERWTPDPADPRLMLTVPADHFDATLASEGVTCAACHVRDGHVVGARADARAPHAARFSAELRDERACASCHQLTWPGADRPLYDTIGEHQRSGWAEAGVTCQDCHMAPPVQGAARSHAVKLPRAQALSALLDLPPAPIVRGQPPTPGTLVLQNTGAGHAVPTGSPFRGARIDVVIEGPAAKGDGRQIWHVAGTSDLVRTLEQAPPWRTTADSRLQAGETRTIPLSMELPVDAPRGRYAIQVRIDRLTAGNPEGEPLLLQTLDLPVH